MGYCYDMKILLLFFCGLLQTGLVLAQSSPLEVYWDDGLRFRSRDSVFRFSAGGRVHYDIAFSRQSPGLDALYKNAGCFAVFILTAKQPAILYWLRWPL